MPEQPREPTDPDATQAHSAPQPELFDGRYELIRELGRGGMAQVWLGWDTQLERNVAVKILDPKLARDPKFVERFRHEARAAAQVSHPNVVPVYDRGELPDGTRYIAMQYVEGPTLRDSLDRGVTIEEGARLVQEILAGAAAAHSLGVTHRDLKPQNVLIAPDGRAEVTDFGIASSGGGGDLTQTGTVVGSANYFSPEQAQGQAVDPRSDLFSIGVILYEALCGRHPFAAENATATAVRIVREPAQLPSSINPQVSAALDSVIARALEKDPARRFQTAEEFSQALDAAMAGEATQLMPRTQSARRVVPAPAPIAVEEEPRSHKGAWVAALLLLLVIAGIIGWALLKPGETEVPRVVGETTEQAQNELRRAGLEWETQTKPSQKPAGVVLSQDPIGGTEVKEGSSVQLVVSAGEASVSVPDVEGLSASAARERLQSAGFEVDKQKEYSKSYPAGNVIRTEPVAGAEIEPGSQVAMVVSEGTRPVEVPDLVGLTQAEAGAELHRLGLVSSVSTQRSDQDAGVVIAQNPAAGEELQPGGKVEVVVSSGVQQIVTPSVVGSDRASAQASIEGAGLEVSIVERETGDSTQDGIVIRQKPAAGKKLDPGDVVELIVGRYVEPPAPPTTTTTPVE